eukprot:6212048-Pleurochrysis_carterae.AAC.3
MEASMPGLRSVIDLRTVELQKYLEAVISLFAEPDGAQEPEIWTPANAFSPVDSCHSMRSLHTYYLLAPAARVQVVLRLPQFN